jgi:hypothetical protein
MKTHAQENRRTWQYLTSVVLAIGSITSLTLIDGGGRIPTGVSKPILVADGGGRIPTQPPPPHVKDGSGSIATASQS